MKEVETSSGAILFKVDESDPQDKRIQILEQKVEKLTSHISHLEELISKIK